MASMSKADYLKRYAMSTGDDETVKKKKKKRTKNGPVKQVQGIKIHDDEVDFKSLLPSNLLNTLEDDIGDNDPTVADEVDDRPEEVKRLEIFRKDNRWKTFLEKDKKRHDSDSDSEPGIKPIYGRSKSDLKKKRRHDSDSDNSPSRGRHDSDESPPRRGTQISSDESPIRKNKRRNDSDSDISPPRNQRHDSDESPPRKNKQRNDSDSDMSPPRNRRLDSDESPPRRGRKDSSDESPPRRGKRNIEIDSDESPPRRRKNDSDESPPRKKITKSRWDPKTSKSRNDSDLDSEAGDKKMRKTLGGAVAGLSTAQAVRDEMAKLKKKEDDAFNRVSSDVLGKNASTVTRRGRKSEQDKEKETQKAIYKKELDEKYKTWGRGLKQAEHLNSRMESDIHEMNKPLARYKDDEDRDDLLKSQDRDGDPMLAFMKTKKAKSRGNKKVLPRYKGPAPPPNRFNLYPGYRWDSVDRSNGFEKSVYEKQNARKARDVEAYKWSVEDM